MAAGCGPRPRREQPILKGSADQLPTEPPRPAFSAKARSCPIPPPKAQVCVVALCREALAGASIRNASRADFDLVVSMLSHSGPAIPLAPCHNLGISFLYPPLGARNLLKPLFVL
jgi:hypothetical protein